MGDGGGNGTVNSSVPREADALAMPLRSNVKALKIKQEKLLFGTTG